MSGRLVLGVFVVAMMGCGGDDGGGGGDRDAAMIACAPGGSCPEVGATCDTAEYHCTCETGAGAAWACEPIACPESSTPGTPCEVPGLTCDGGFEDPGVTCVAPENVWTACSSLRWDGMGPRLWCPTDPPSEGSPCCVRGSASPPPDECPYPDMSVYRCVDEHWRRQR